MYLLKNRFKYFSSVLTCIIYLNTNTLYAQKVELIPEPGFIDYSIYYLNSIDFKNASMTIKFSSGSIEHQSKVEFFHFVYIVKTMRILFMQKFGLKLRSGIQTLEYMVT